MDLIKRENPWQMNTPGKNCECAEDERLDVTEPVDPCSAHTSVAKRNRNGDSVDPACVDDPADHVINR